MSARLHGLAALVFCSLLVPSPALAQLPTATGRSFTLSDTAWKLFIPSGYEQRPGSVADLLVHFHGDPQTVWNNALYADLNSVIVTVNYSGLSAAYSGPFTDPLLFKSLLDEALGRVRAETDFPDDMEWDQLGVSSFSAGYGAVREILKYGYYRHHIDTLLAADSLYATTAGDGTPLDSQMEDYKTFAELAQAGQKTFLFSHSQVPTYTYESTMETGDELLDHLGITAQPVNQSGLGTLEFYRHAESGNFQLWGALGSDGDAHLEHLRYIGEFFEQLPLSRLPLFDGDADLDGDVDLSDLMELQRTGDGQDLLAWQAHFDGAPVGAAMPVPEPGTAAILLLGMLAVGLRNR